VNLKTLKLERNRLDLLPADLASLAKLVSLAAGHNPLGGGGLAHLPASGKLAKLSVPSCRLATPFDALARVGHMGKGERTGTAVRWTGGGHVGRVGVGTTFATFSFSVACRIITFPLVACCAHSRVAGRGYAASA